MSQHTGRRRAALGATLAIAASALALLLGVSLAEGAKSTVSAQATITGSGTSYRLTVRNTGTEAILCFGLLLTGVQPTSASGPTGVLTRVGTFQGRGLVHMQGTAATPAIPAGGTAIVDFQTNVAIPANAGGEIRYSPSCQPGSDVVGQATGPTPPPPPPPPPPPGPKKCACKDLKTRIVPNRLLVPTNVPGGMEMEILVEWTLTCTKGAGDCEGTLELVPSARAKRLGTSITAPAAGKVTCKGPCGKTTTRAQKFVVKAGPRFGEGKRGRSVSLLRLEMKRVCKSTRVRQIFEIVFTRTGAVDRGRSDLNANGVQDRRDR